MKKLTFLLFISCFCFVQKVHAQLISVNKDSLDFIYPGVDTLIFYNTGNFDLVIDSMSTESQFFGYTFHILNSDSALIPYIWYFNATYSDTFTITIPPNDSAQIFFDNADLCPICSPNVTLQPQTYFEDKFYFFSNSLANDTLEIPVSGDGLATTKEENNFPKDFELSQNYPNPFNPTTKIEYQLPNFSKGRLTIFNIIGKIIRDFDLDNESSSVYWNGKNNFGKPVASGIYFYKLELGKFSKTRKMLLLK